MTTWNVDWFDDWIKNWFGNELEPDIPGSDPEGVGTFVLELLNGYTVTLRYVTDIIKTRSGKEQRISRNDSPREYYQGKVLLLDDSGADIRTQLAELAAKGLPFRLALPHEELSIRADSAGTTVYVHTTTKSDWLNPGQRVVVKRDGVGVDAVVQSTTSDSITLDIEPGSLGLRGGSIMPTMPILLEPEQAFPRYRTAAEEWDIRARAVAFDFARKLGSLSIGPLTLASGLNSATVTERYPGACSTFSMLDDAGILPSVSETSDAVVVHFSATSPTHTIEDIYALLQTSTRVVPTGTWGTGNLSVDDQFGDTALTGGQLAGPIGTGASVATYNSRPLWDRRLRNEGTIVDSVQAMTEIVDHDGVPYALGWADMADWGRAVHYHGTGLDEWQWLKLFLATVKGRQKSFYLSTWRNDLPFVSKATNTITVEGNVRVWWPLQRQHVQVWETDGTLTRAEVTAALDNGDGTYTLTIGTTLATSSVQMVSWLELCRFTSDEFPISFDDDGFSLRTVATVAQAGEDYDGDVYGDDEWSAEASEPRELFTITLNDGVTVYRHTSASRDILYGGQIYTALAMDRGPIALANVDEEEETAIILPIDHELARRWTAMAAPPWKAEVTILRRQERSEGVEIIWRGDITSMSTEKGVARFRVPSQAGQWMLRPVPSFSVSDSCVHTLFDENCGLDPDVDTGPFGIEHKVTCSVLAVSGRDVRVDLANTYRNGTWAVDGKFLHTASGEPRVIVGQTDQAPGTNAITTLRLSLPVPGMKVGDSVTVTIGCPKSITQCVARFDNRQRFLGWNLKPGMDMYSPVLGGFEGGIE